MEHYMHNSPRATQILKTRLSGRVKDRMRFIV